VIGFFLRRIPQAAIVVLLVTMITFILLRPSRGSPEPGARLKSSRA
jgi:ABC-type dipeptide/oligopeptide/nickel transport system permease component